MSFQKASTSFTRFRIIDDIPADLWASIPEKLRQYAFIDIDDIAEERAFGWTSFDDMLDTEWRQAPPEKGDFLTFSLRLDTRRIPPPCSASMCASPCATRKSASRNWARSSSAANARRRYRNR